MEHFDVLVVGAGISGIGAGYHLQTLCPDRSYAILEGRAALGGTWDLFRYPGIRSDSDMYTLGYHFRPWTEPKAIADGPNILTYLQQVAHDHGIDRKIRYDHQVKRAAWSTADATWTVEAETPGGPVTLTCNFLFMCSGYYNYAKGHSPEFAGAADFAGRIVHPQFWPQDLDYTGKEVVVIGSGATAVTLVPAMAGEAAHVTMLQRSPTYIVARPAEDAMANWLRTKLPAKLAYGIVRWRNVLLGMFFFNRMRKHPDKAKERLLGMVREQLPDADIETHFTPRYNPWDQRLCLVPDGDLFTSIRDGKAEIVTDTIDRFVPDGIRLTSGKTLPADVIVTATGLELQLLSGVQFTVDGEAKDLSKTTNYKGMMYSGIPNLASSFGYTNASWTLKADLTCGYVCRLLNTMKKRGLRQATPTPHGAVGEEPFLDFTSGYVQRARDVLPKQGTRKPWKVHQNYAKDLMALKFGSVDNEMVFSNPVPKKVKAAA
ncbi:MAG: NAD(P)/FAD-dependent oxidoreductase [Sphingomonas sp.]|uniref:flavin-containing monooxygenase n=1 Tax=Sphingomonas sp. TaxID=28214 RepID=UPI001AC7CD4F|nr:NAD(P)/FAD-dependent oxidoreductase [Sphingomonas sp.]MBN8807747.1 NAD(P)/FAD-dependent oxidoreductase [Sphingomonas sp.]